MVGVWQPRQHIGAQLVNMPNALVWNELQTKDVDTARSFYGEIFGWGHDSDPNGYDLFKLGERMQAGMLKKDDSWGDVPPNWAPYFMSRISRRRRPRRRSWAASFMFRRPIRARSVDSR